MLNKRIKAQKTHLEKVIVIVILIAHAKLDGLEVLLRDNKFKP